MPTAAIVSRRPYGQRSPFANALRNSVSVRWRSWGFLPAGGHATSGAMSHLLSRRELAGGLVVLPLTAPAQAPPQRHLLRTAMSGQDLHTLVLPRQGWTPFPSSLARPAWHAVPKAIHKQLVPEAESHLGKPWPALPAAMLLEFKRNGNRSNYEGVRSERRDRLQALAIAECLEGKGRFLDEIANGVWSTCEETFWGVPAHLSRQRAGIGLPDVTDPIVDLFAAETSSLLAWIHYLLAPSLERVSPLLPKRIAWEIDRRVLTPCLERDDYLWMGFQGTRPVNNWNPWINSNWLASTLLMEPDATRRIASVAKILRSLDRFLDGYSDDGGCDEGPSYWTRAGASLFDCLQLLDSASGGTLDFFRMPLIREIGRYIWRAHIHADWFLNFADASARVKLPADLVYRYGRRIGDANLAAFGAHAAKGTYARSDSIGRTLHSLFNRGEITQAPARQPLARDVWMPGIQVMAARVNEGSADGLFLAAQGGHNDESHNHNDVGNFIVYADGEPAIIDVGVETYTARTFSANRYDIWTMQSAYHNLPTIGGVMQAPGREFTARRVSYRSDDRGAEFQLDIAAAYPPAANIRSWLRTLRLDRSHNRIEIREQFDLAKGPPDITLTFMTPCRPFPAAGVVRLSGGFLSKGAVELAFDSRVFTAGIEEIPIADARLRSSWGEHLYRVLLRADRPAAQQEWAYTIRQV